MLLGYLQPVEEFHAIRTVRETTFVAGLARVQYWPRLLRSLATPATKTGHLLVERSLNEYSIV